MDPKFTTLYSYLQDKKQSLFISCIVQGVLVTGFIITEQTFFVESNRIMHDQINTSPKERAFFEEIFLTLSKAQGENYLLHLGGVKIHFPSGVQNMPTLRIDPTHVSAWSPVFPVENDAYEYLPKLLPNFPLKPDA